VVRRWRCHAQQLRTARPSRGVYKQKMPTHLVPAQHPPGSEQNLPEIAQAVVHFFTELQRSVQQSPLTLQSDPTGRFVHGGVASEASGVGGVTASSDASAVNPELPEDEAGAASGLASTIAPLVEGSVASEPSPMPAIEAQPTTAAVADVTMTRASQPIALEDSPCSPASARLIRATRPLLPRVNVRRSFTHTCSHTAERRGSARASRAGNVARTRVAPRALALNAFA
jgi:hypothetical protein